MEEISIIIPTHNRANFIGETLRSVMDQTFQDFEIIIIDDGSTDDTEAVIAAFNDPRIRYFKYERIGSLAKLRNIAINKSSKLFLAFIDSDDLWHPNKLQKCLDACIHGNYDICITDSLEFNGTQFKERSNGHRLAHKQDVDIKHEILINNEPLSTNMFLRRKVYDTVEGFDESLFHSDHDFLCRALYSSRGVYLPEVMSFMRRHGSNMSWNENNLDLSSIIEYNGTLKKIADQNGITKNDFRKATSDNYYRMAIYSVQNKLFKQSFSYVLRALRFKVQVKKTLSYFKRLVF